MLGHKTKVIYRKAFNPFGFEGSIRGSAKQFYFRTILMSRKFDIIHVHAVDRIVPMLKRIYNRPILLTYHGTDIRGRWEEKEKYWKKADFVSVATPDLLEGAPPEAQYIVNPVDIEHFKRINNFIPDSVLFVSQNGLEWLLDIVRAETRKRDLRLTVQNRSMCIIPYSAYPRFLELYEYYIDIKECFGKINPAMSLTAFQFLALGGKVIYLGKEYEGLPEIYNPDRIAKLWIDIYDKYK